MPVGDRREKTLFGLGRARGRLHRYTLIRWAIGIVVTLAIALIPLTGVLRFDLWAGRHMWLGEPAGLVRAIKAFAFPFLGINIAIILASRFVGRYLCGFACPYGAFARAVEWLRWREHRGASRLWRFAAILGSSLLLAAITFTWWIDWRVFLAGSTTAIAISAGLLAAMTIATFVVIDGIGLRFCRDWCPSGVYFAVLGAETTNGIEFAHPEACTECKACEVVCPMDLFPTEMESERERAGHGFYPDGITNHAACIRCGDCVVACEGTTAHDPAPTPLRMGFLPREGDAA